MLRRSILIRIDPPGRAFCTVVPFLQAYSLCLLLRHPVSARKPPRQRFSRPRTIAQLSNMDEIS
jgi:hypothetical protein